MVSGRVEELGVLSLSSGIRWWKLGWRNGWHWREFFGFWRPWRTDYWVTLAHPV